VAAERKNKIEELVGNVSEKSYPGHDRSLAS
jgi:hypothetical protein